MRIGLLVLVVLLEPLAGVGPSRGSTDQGLLKPIDSPFDCIDCISCGLQQHATGWWSPNPDYSPEDGPHTCGSGWCLSHGVCGGKEEESATETPLEVELEAIRRAVASGQASELSDVLGWASPRVKMSTSRSAIQVSGCGGEIVAHFPLPPGTIEKVMHQQQ